jgi:hypothetical protein
LSAQDGKQDGAAEHGGSGELYGGAQRGQHVGQREATQDEDGQSGEGGDAGSRRDTRHGACHLSGL